jgi:DNA-binding MarR family transcriptional regulator
MSSSKQFNAAMRGWSEAFMHRSMHEWMRYIKSLGLSMPQFSILMRLYHGKGCGVSEISEYLDVTTAAASQIVDRLVQANLIQRNEDPNDRRAKQIELSAKGKAIIEKGVEARNKWLDDLAAHLSPQQREQVIASLELLVEAAHKIESHQG